MSRASSGSIRSISPPNSADNLKTGFLVTGFRDSEDMTGWKEETAFDGDAIDAARLLLLAGYGTVMIERRRPATR